MTIKSHPVLSPDEFERRLQMLAELDQADFDRLKILLENQRKGDAVGEWLGKKRVFIVAGVSSFMLFMTFGEQLSQWLKAFLK